MLLTVVIIVILLQAEAKSLDVTQMSVSQIEDAVQVSHTREFALSTAF